MPKVYHFKREFVNIRISKRLYDYLCSQKRYKEPLDRIADRIFSHVDAVKALDEFYDAQEIIDNKDRIIKSLTDENRILKQKVKELKQIDVQLTQFMRNDD